MNAEIVIAAQNHLAGINPNGELTARIRQLEADNAALLRRSEMLEEFWSTVCEAARSVK